MRFEEIGKLPITIADGNYSAKYPRSDEFKDKGIPFIRANNFKDHDIIDDDLLFISEKKHSELKKGHLMEGDILITTRGNIGNTAIVPERHIDSNINAQIVLLRPDSSINNIYLRLILSSPEVVKQINALTTGTALKQLPVGNLKKIKLPIPPIRDQIRIANILSKAEALISQRKEGVRLLDKLLKSTFLEMFGDPVRNEKGWEKLNGEEYCEKLTVGVVIKPASYYVEEGVIAIRSLNIKPNRIDLKNVVYFSKETNERELAKSILREGDVVFVRTGVTGTAAIVPKELDGCNCIDLIITRPKRDVLNKTYLVFFFNSDFGKRLVSSKEVGGIQKHFNIGAIKALKIPVPPLKLQTQFAHIVEKTEALKVHYKTSLQELENLYGSLSQRAFKGELNLMKEELTMDSI